MCLPGPEVAATRLFQVCSCSWPLSFSSTWTLSRPSTSCLRAMSSERIHTLVRLLLGSFGGVRSRRGGFGSASSAGSAFGGFLSFFLPRFQRPSGSAARGATKPLSRNATGSSGTRIKLSPSASNANEVVSMGSTVTSATDQVPSSVSSACIATVEAVTVMTTASSCVSSGARTDAETTVIESRIEASFARDFFHRLSDKGYSFHKMTTASLRQSRRWTQVRPTASESARIRESA